MTQRNSGIGTGIGIGVGILIGCGVALVVCLVVGGIAAVVVGNGVVKLAGTAVSAVTTGPYEISKRPLPSESAQDILLPLTVGSFTRGEVTTGDSVFSTTYTSGSDTVTAVAKVYSSVTLAQSAIKAANTADPTLSFHISGFDPSYATDSIQQGKATKIFYSRGKYEFHFVGSSSSALDTFMTQFPF